MTIDTDTKNEMLERIEQTYTDLIQFIDTLDEETIVERPDESEWSVQDVLAHVTAWEGVLLRFHLSGESFEDVIGVSDVRYRVTSFDEINQYLYETYRDWTLEEVREFAQRTHKNLLRRLAELSDEELRAPLARLSAMGLEAEALITYIAGITYEHYLEHLEAVRRVADRPE